MFALKHGLFAAVLTLSMVPCGARASADDDVRGYLRDAAATWKVPSLQAAVVRDGAVVFTGVAGDAARDEPMPVASVGKQFTAAAVLALVRARKVALRDRVGSYVDDLPPAWSDVTLYQMLTHTSGIPSYHEAAGYAAQLSHAVTPRQLLRFAASLPVLFPRGTASRYSNTNFILLGMVIEKVSGVPYDRYLARTLFEPLRMSRTSPCTSTPRGFVVRNGAREPAPVVDPSQTWAAGGICSTASDLARWEAGLDTGRVLPRDLVAAMESPARLDDGTRTPRYGIGNELDVVNGHRVTGHEGGMPGFTAVLYRLPDDRTSVAIVADQTSAPVSAIARHVATAFVPSLASAPAAADADPALTARLRHVVVDAASGTADPSAFAGGETNRNVAIIRRQGPGLIGVLGALTAFAPIASRDAAERRFLATYERGSVEWIFRLDGDGRIVDLEPQLR